MVSIEAWVLELHWLEQSLWRLKYFEFRSFQKKITNNLGPKKQTSIAKALPTSVDAMKLFWISCLFCVAMYTGMNATQITRRENVQKQMHLDSLKFMGYLKLNVPKTVATMRSALSYTTDRRERERERIRKIYCYHTFSLFSEDFGQVHEYWLIKSNQRGRLGT